ncbi:putative NTP pyrophosphohydrolase [Burkholderia phage vB_BglM_WTB]
MTFTMPPGDTTPVEPANPNGNQAGQPVTPPAPPAPIDYFGRIVGWANDRNLVAGSDSKSQYLKLVSEFGEYLAATIARRVPGTDPFAANAAIADGIGDVAVVLTIIAAQNSVTFTNADIAAPAYFGGLVERWDQYFDMAFGLAASIGDLGDAIAKSQPVEPILRKAMLQLQYCAQMGWPLYASTGNDTSPFTNCLTNAWSDIKDRQGVMYNGVFVKSTDPNYAAALAALQASQTQAS